MVYFNLVYGLLWMRWLYGGVSLNRVASSAERSLKLHLVTLWRDKAVRFIFNLV